MVVRAPNKGRDECGYGCRKSAKRESVSGSVLAPFSGSACAIDQRRALFYRGSSRAHQPFSAGVPEGTDLNAHPCDSAKDVRAEAPVILPISSAGAGKPQVAVLDISVQ